MAKKKAKKASKPAKGKKKVEKAQDQERVALLLKEFHEITKGLASNI